MRSSLDHGVFTLSLDFELAWGSRDLHAELPASHPLLRQAAITRERVFNPLLDMLVDRDIVATWATVGHLFLDRAHRDDGVLHPDIVPPRHPWRQAPWFEGVPEGTEAQHPEFYGRSLVRRLIDAGQDVGCHGFSHEIYGDLGCARQCADTALSKSVALAKELGISLKSMVFPRNSVGHRDILAKHGFSCWRGPEPSLANQRGVPRSLGRASHLLAVARAAQPPTVMPYRDDHGMWCVPATVSFLPVSGVRRLIPVSRRVERAMRGIDAAARDRRLCHLWFHPINLADDPSTLLDAIRQILDHAARLRDRGDIDVLSMAGVAGLAGRGETP